MVRQTASPNNFTINLFRGLQFEATPLGKALSWALKIGRILVFVTFGIVMACFLYRFSLDKQIESLVDRMENGLQSLAEYQETEPQIKQFQDQLNQISQMIKTEKNYISILETLEAILPQQAHIDEISFKEDELTLTGTADNELAFSLLLQQLVKEKTFANVVVNTLQSGGVENPEVRFDITLILAIT